MRVLLINPWETGEFPPPSIAYLQAALKHWKVDVVVKDLPDAMIDTKSYDLVAVSFHSFSVKYARQIRDQFKGKLICGGHHPSAMPEQMLSIGYDQVVVGEGENATIDIIYTEVNFEEVYKGCCLVGELDNFLKEWGFTRVLTDDTPKLWGDALYLKPW